MAVQEQGSDWDLMKIDDNQAEKVYRSLFKVMTADMI